MKLSVVIPARNEEGAVEETVSTLLGTLRAEAIPCEIIVVDDGSTDKTAFVVQALSARYSEIRLVQNTGRHGFGMAVRCGLHEATGDAVAIVMADSSDSPEDVVKCYRRLLEGPDCVFGSRFIRGSKVHDYPYPQTGPEPPGKLVHQGALWRPLQRLHQCLQTLSSRSDRGYATAHLPPF